MDPIIYAVLSNLPDLLAAAASADWTVVLDPANSDLPFTLQCHLPAAALPLMALLEAKALEEKADRPAIVRGHLRLTA